VALLFLPAPGEFHNFLYRLVGMKGGVDETASVRSVTHNKFIDQIIYLAGTLADDGNQDNAISDAQRTSLGA
jgi:hypothetical protein